MISTRRLKKRKGQGLVEFALVFPVLMLLLFATIELGWVAFSYNQIFNALREGLRYASVPGTNAAYKQYTACDAMRSYLVSQAGLVGVKASDITVTYDNGNPSTTVGTCPAGTNTPTVTIANGNRIFIEVKGNIHFLTPFFQVFATNGFNIDLKGSRSIFPDGIAALG